MAKWVCPCGEVLRSSGDIPNPTEWHAISDAGFEVFTGRVDADDVYSASTLFYRCPKCGRLHFFWDGADGAITVYSP